MSEHPTTVPSPDLVAHLTAYTQGVLGNAGQPTITPYAAGCHNQIYLCLTQPVTAQWPERFVIRYPKGPQAIAMLDAYETRAESTDDDISPRILHLGRLSCGTPIAFEQYIEGESRPLADLSQPDIVQLGHMLSAIHRRSSDRYSRHSGAMPEVSGTYADYARAMVQESVVDRMQALPMDRYPVAQRLLDAGLVRLESMLAAGADAFSGTAFCRLHHDLNQQNILWHEGQPVSIDPNTTYGDPADDLDYICTDNMVTLAFREELIAAYVPPIGAGDVAARVPVYTLKNRLDDMAWAISMRESNPDDFDAIYLQRLSLLQDALDTSGQAA